MFRSPLIRVVRTAGHTRSILAISERLWVARVVASEFRSVASSQGRPERDDPQRLRSRPTIKRHLHVSPVPRAAEARYERIPAVPRDRDAERVASNRGHPDQGSALVECDRGRTGTESDRRRRSRWPRRRCPRGSATAGKQDGSNCRHDAPMGCTFMRRSIAAQVYPACRGLCGRRILGAGLPAHVCPQPGASGVSG